MGERISNKLKIRWKSNPEKFHTNKGLHWYNNGEINKMFMNYPGKEWTKGKIKHNKQNSKGEFNVPHGRYTNPKICDKENLIAVSQLLQRVEILCGDFEQTEIYAGENSIFYLDPPYKSDFAINALEKLNEYELLNDDATIVVEHEFQNDLQNAPECYIMKKSKKYFIGSYIGAENMFFMFLKSLFLKIFNVIKFLI